MKNKFLWGLTFFPIFITLGALPFVPDQIPAHFDLAGQVDRWGSKYELFLLPVTIVLMTFFFAGLNRIYKKKLLTAKSDKEIEEAKLNSGILTDISIGTVIYFSAMQLTVLYNSIAPLKGLEQKMALDISSVMTACMGVFLIFIGNVMGRVKKNGVLGLRTSWSMKNDRIWAKSNRFAGKLFVAAGFVVIIASAVLKGSTAVWVMLAVLWVVAFLSIVYSYRAAKKDCP